MTQGDSETAIVLSALVVGGEYTYRKFTEKITKGHIAPGKTKSNRTIGQTATGVIGYGELLPVGTFVTGAGMSFIIISILGAASPDIGGRLAILVATAATLANGQAFFKDLRHESKRSLEGKVGE